MRLAANQLDRRFEEIRPLLKQLERPSRGWIKALREGLGMTTAQLARRMGVSQPRIAELEKAEAARNVTLSSLERAAEALDCRLVYVLVPNRPLSERLEERADQVAEEQLAAVDQTMKLEKQSVSNAKQRETMKQRIVMALLDKPSRLWQVP
ncbi:MAG: mobile mystery protein A [Hyphomonadaceae bacterium]|nr:mobile mystery protein A [Hyphomonadaceae bacterium]